MGDYREKAGGWAPERVEVCEHGIHAPWACNECDQAALDCLHRAAPDLYEALENASGLLDNAVARRRYKGDPFYEDTVASIRAALSRARGEQS